MTTQPSEDVLQRLRNGDDLSGINLARTSLRHLEIRGATLRGARFAGAVLDRVTIVDSDLSGADLSGVTATGLVLSGCQLQDANLSAADLRGTRVSACDMAGATLTNADLAESRWSGVSLRGAQARGVSCELARWADVDAAEAVLARADFARSRLAQVNLRAADVRGASFLLARLQNVSFTDAKLSRFPLLLVAALDEGDAEHVTIVGAWRVAKRGAATLWSHARRVPTRLRPWRRQGAWAALGIVLALGTAAVGRVAVGAVVERLRYNSGIPVASPQLQRLDDETFAYIERGFIHVLTWDGRDLRLVRRYRIDYREDLNLYFLHNSMPEELPAQAR